MIKLQNLTTGYGKHTVLKDVTVTFEKGMVTGIIGVNGCGKSTLLKAMLDLIPAEGNISLDDRNLKDMSRKEIAQKAAYLSQGKTTPDMTVEQLVLHGRFPHLNYPRHYSKRDREIAYTAMEQMGILDLAQNPLGELSGGMRQNAYIAMALTQDTDYILLDEPTTYLDISHQLELMQVLRKLAGNGKGIVAVMHDLPIAFTYCDQILLLDGGSILAQGAPQQVCDHIEKVFGVGMEFGEHYHYKYLL